MSDTVDIIHSLESEIGEGELNLLTLILTVQERDTVIASRSDLPAETTDGFYRFISYERCLDVRGIHYVQYEEQQEVSSAEACGTHCLDLSKDDDIYNVGFEIVLHFGNEARVVCSCLRHNDECCDGTAVDVCGCGEIATPVENTTPLGQITNGQLTSCYKSPAVSKDFE